MTPGAATVRVFPPGCGVPGCQHHYSHVHPACTCPRWFDSGGDHLISVNPECTAHTVPEGGHGLAAGIGE